LYILGILLITSSCIKWGLENLPLASGSDITHFYFEYRFSSTNANGYSQLEFVTLTTDNTITGNNITSVITIPNPSGVFTAQEAAKVNLTDIVGSCDISDAATIKPINGAPELGVVADWSQPHSYLVTAADGTSKTWTITASITP
jgi:hypothetical protein